MSRHRSGRYGHLEASRQTRRVSQDTHNRCLRACLDHKDDLREEEKFLLSAVASAWATDLPVSKGDLDRAMGILGRLNQKGQI